MFAYIILKYYVAVKNNKNLKVNSFVHTSLHKSLHKKIGFQVPPETFNVLHCGREHTQIHGRLGSEEC